MSVTVAVIFDCTSLPAVDLEPLQPPEAVHDVALVEDQVRVLLPPDATLVGEALRVTDTAEGEDACVVTLTAFDGGEIFPAASSAFTVYEYAVAGLRPASE